MYNNGKVGKDCFRRWDKRQSAGKERLLILKSLPSLGGGGRPWPYSMADVIVVHRHNRGGRSMVASLSMGQVRRRNPRMFIACRSS